MERDSALPPNEVRTEDRFNRRVIFDERWERSVERLEIVVDRIDRPLDRCGYRTDGAEIEIERGDQPTFEEGIAVQAGNENVTLLADPVVKAVDMGLIESPIEIHPSGDVIEHSFDMVVGSPEQAKVGVFEESNPLCGAGLAAHPVGEMIRERNLAGRKQQSGVAPAGEKDGVTPVVGYALREQLL